MASSLDGLKPSLSRDSIEEGRKWGERVSGTEWTCARCGVTVSFMPGVARLSELPASWEQVNGVAYCLGCRRALAGDAEGRIEFELGRDPDRCDTRIARAASTSVIVVRRVRERLGTFPTRPV